MQVFYRVVFTIKSMHRVVSTCGQDDTGRATGRHQDLQQQQLSCLYLFFFLGFLLKKFGLIFKSPVATLINRTLVVWCLLYICIIMR